MKEGLNVPQTLPECLKLYTSAHTQNLPDLDLAAKDGNMGNTVQHARKKKGHTPV